MKRRALAIAMIGISIITSMTGCGTMSNENTPGNKALTSPSKQQTQYNKAKVKSPKYIFMFIGDGMSYPQVQLTNYYLNASANAKNTDTKKVTVNGAEKEILESHNRLTMMNFKVAGSAQTYDSTSFAPDSASTATSLATGEKTWSGSINVSEDFTTKYETITKKLKEQKQYKVGIISSVNLNHATPAAFYAHQASRNSYYEIGLELIESNFDYFAGGGLKKTTGDNKDQTDLYELAIKDGYKVVKTQAEAQALTAKDGKVIVIDEHLADSEAMSYEIDREEGHWALADYVEKGIEVLDNENGFFMMVEGGKIDWACHANDATSTISDTIALDHAVKKAVEFYNEHKEETLILVTGDHETGGLTIGYAGTNYDTFLTNFENQKISYAKYDTDYVANYKQKKTSFSQVLKDAENLFGLTAAESSLEKDKVNSKQETENKGTLVMTEYEYDKLKEAYKTTLKRTEQQSEVGQKEYEMYGSYEPLTVTITHILNNKSGVNFGSYAHTGLPVGVFVQGEAAQMFEGYYDNTDIYHTLAKLTGVK